MEKKDIENYQSEKNSHIEKILQLWDKYPSIKLKVNYNNQVFDSLKDLFEYFLNPQFRFAGVDIDLVDWGEVSEEDIATIKKTLDFFCKNYYDKFAFYDAYFTPSNVEIKPDPNDVEAPEH